MFTEGTHIKSDAILQLRRITQSSPDGVKDAGSAVDEPPSPPALNPGEGVIRPLPRAGRCASNSHDDRPLSFYGARKEKPHRNPSSDVRKEIRCGSPWVGLGSGVGLSGFKL